MDFEELAGLVRIRLLREETTVIGAELVAPHPLCVADTVDVAAAAACLSLPPADIETTTHPPLVASIGLPFLIVAVKSRDALKRSKPSIGAHEQILPPLGVDAVYAYFLAENGEEIHARTFAPLDNCLEDPATGSATGAAIALITQRTGAPTECRSWRVHQGTDMGRPSLIMGSVTKQRGEIEEVRIAGHVVLVSEGVISVR